MGDGQRLLPPRLYPMEVEWAFGVLEFDSQARTVRWDGTPVHLERREFEVLDYFLRYAGATVTRRAVTGAVWGGTVTLNAAEQYVSRLRRKLHRQLFETRYGHGWRMAVPLRTRRLHGVR